MELAVEIYNGYVRSNLFLIFFIGVAVVTYRQRAKWAAYLETPRLARWKGFLDIDSETLLPRVRAAAALAWSYWKWVIMFGVPATILDLILGQS